MHCLYEKTRIKNRKTMKKMLCWFFPDEVRDFCMLLAYPLSEGLQNTTKHCLILKIEHLSGIQFNLFFFHGKTVCRQHSSSVPRFSKTTCEKPDELRFSSRRPCSGKDMYRSASSLEMQCVFEFDLQ